MQLLLTLNVWQLLCVSIQLGFTSELKERLQVAMMNHFVIHQNRVMMFPVLGISCSTHSLTSDLPLSFPCSLCGAEHPLPLCHYLLNSDVFLPSLHFEDIKINGLGCSPEKFKTKPSKFTIRDPAAFKWDEVITSKNKCTVILFDTVQIEQNMSRISYLDPEATSWWVDVVKTFILWKRSQVTAGRFTTMWHPQSLTWLWKKKNSQEVKGDFFL